MNTENYNIAFYSVVFEVINDKIWTHTPEQTGNFMNGRSNCSQSYEYILLVIIICDKKPVECKRV